MANTRLLIQKKNNIKREKKGKKNIVDCAPKWRKTKKNI